MSRSSLLSIRATLATRRSPCSRAAISEPASVCSVRSSSARSGRYVTMLIVSVEAATVGMGLKRWVRIVVDCPRAVNPCPLEFRMTAIAQRTTRFRADDLRAFARALLDRAGVRADIGRDVADILLEADLLGHTTHGLALLAPYLSEIDKGAMAKDGEPRVVARRAAAETWDGARLQIGRAHV